MQKEDRTGYGSLLEYLFLPLLLLILLLSTLAAEADPFTCSFTTGCTATSLLYAQNDTGGATNSHSQNLSFITYDNSLCCDANSTGAANSTTFLMDCANGAAFLDLENETSAHVQVANYTGPQAVYNYSVCLGAASGSVACDYFLTSCPSDYTCLASIASSNLTNNNETDAHIGPCASYALQICCNLSIPNTAPPSPTLLDPPDQNETLNRTPTFVWSSVTDADGDAVTYVLNITCYALAGGSCPDGSDDRIINVSTNSTIPAAELQYFIDDGYYYNWTALATDGMNDSNWASPAFTLNVSVLVDITLNNSYVSFGSLSLGQSAQSSECTSGEPDPCSFILVNRGNADIELNLSENSTSSLFISAPAPTSNYLFKGSNASEGGAFNWSSSITLFTQVPRTENLTVFKGLNHTADANQNRGVVDINVTIPADESPGYKESTLEFIGYYRSPF
ncbi:MAG TPA: hypothetical protein VJH37_02440 [Candidatus Nanoarchaeia archaeon]|nr:hypothetical protein [Candidatus Nanoarchaeia archaeon]